MNYQLLLLPFLRSWNNSLKIAIAGNPWRVELLSFLSTVVF